LIIDLRVQRFEFAPRAAEHVEFVRHVDGGVVEIELIDDAGLAERDTVQFFAGGAELRVDAGQEGAAGLRREIFTRLSQRGARRGNVRAVDDGLMDQRVEWFAMKERPPGGGNVLCWNKALRQTGGARRGGCLLGQRRGGVGVGSGRRGRMVVGADHAAGHCGAATKRDAQALPPDNTLVNVDHLSTLYRLRLA
jgi:hypothetical protein